MVDESTLVKEGLQAVVSLCHLSIGHLNKLQQLDEILWPIHANKNKN